MNNQTAILSTSELKAMELRRREKFAKQYGLLVSTIEALQILKRVTRGTFDLNQLRRTDAASCRRQILACLGMQAGQISFPFLRVTLIGLMPEPHPISSIAQDKAFSEWAQEQFKELS